MKRLFALLLLAASLAWAQTSWNANEPKLQSNFVPLALCGHSCAWGFYVEARTDLPNVRAFEVTLTGEDWTEPNRSCKVVRRIRNSKPGEWNGAAVSVPLSCTVTDKKVVGIVEIAP